MFVITTIRNSHETLICDENRNNMKLLGKYQNGNYKVMLLEDGTKIRYNDLDNLTPDFAESMDVKLTDKCSVGCSFCYEKCTPLGKHSNIMEQKWIQTLHPWTEIAVNGNDLDHPQLDEFLDLMKSKNIVLNMTLNQVQFMKNKDQVDKYLADRKVYGLGISMSENLNPDLLDELAGYPNVVLHMINGLITPEMIDKYEDKLRKLKILVLGYKYVGRGIDYKDKHDSEVQKNIDWLRDNIIDLLQPGRFKVGSFDNLAITQLDLEKQVRTKTDLKWEELYMGDDGDYSFYIDAVSQTFAKNSTISKDQNYPVLESVDDMFNFIRNGKESKS